MMTWSVSGFLVKNLTREKNSDDEGGVFGTASGGFVGGGKSF